jgi:hypothetical protein
MESHYSTSLNLDILFLHKVHKKILILNFTKNKLNSREYNNIRSKQCMLDNDLAVICQVETRKLME